MSVRQLSRHDAVSSQSSTWFSINKSRDPWREEPDCLQYIRSGKNCRNTVSRHIVVFGIAAAVNSVITWKRENFNGCGLHSPNKGEKRATNDESQLCDDDVMVVTALINAICLMGLPCYPPRPASFTSVTELFLAWQWLEVQVAHNDHRQTMLQTSDVSGKIS